MSRVLQVMMILLGLGLTLAQDSLNLSQVVELKQLMYFGSVLSIVFSPDGKTLTTGGVGNTIQAWDVLSGAQLKPFPRIGSDLRTIALSPDGQTLASGSDDKIVRIWSVSTRTELRRFTGHSSSVRSITFSPDGRRLATGGYLDTARIWDVSTGAELKRFKGGSQGISSLAFSPDGRTLATASGFTQIWDISTGAELKRFTSHSNVRSIAFSPDGRSIATGGFDRITRIWDVSSGAELKRFNGSSDEIFSVAFSPDGRTIATGSGVTQIWDVSSGTELKRFNVYSNVVYSVAFSPDGQILAAGGFDTKVRIYGTPDSLPVFDSRKFTGTPQITAPATGFLQVDAPEGAAIFIQDVSVGVGTVTKSLTTGSYTVRVTRLGLQDFVQTVTITAGQTTRVAAALKALTTSLRINSSTPNATLTIDGRAIGSLPSSGYTYQTSSNTAIVVITAPGFKTETRSVNLQAGQLTDLQLNLQPEPTPLIINSSTPNARASVDGVDRGLIPSGGLSLTITASSATVVITAPDYEPIRQDVTRNPSGVTRVTANLERSTGQLVIRSKPNAEVRVSDSIVGRTDRTGLFSTTAPVGAVTITVQLEGFKTFSRTVTVTRNQTLEVSATLEAIPATLTIQSNTPNARVRIGGEEISIIGGDFRIELTPGTKVVQVIAAGFETQTFSLNVNAGEQIVREVNLTPRAVTTPPAPVTPPVSPPSAPVFNTGNAPTANTKPRDDVYALVIGIDDYKNSGIPDLKTAVTDAKRFAAALENPRIGNIARGNIRVLLNDAATKVDLEGEFTDALGTLKPNQTLIVYFAGHGAPTPDGNSLLLPVDANPNASRLEISSIALPDWTRRAEGKRVLFVLDSCFSGQTGTRSLTADATRPVAAQIVAPKPTGLVTILGATSSNQSSQENTTGGLFTSALLEGLGGKADANKDGVVTLEEAFTYTQREVSGSTRSAQIPSLNGTGLNLFAFAQNTEVLALANVNSRLAKIDVLYKLGKLTVQQYNVLSSMIEGMREARELKLFLDGDSSMPEDAFLRLLRRGLIAGVPSGTP